jgi:hypothetical protein
MFAAAFTAGAKTTASTLTMDAILPLRHGAPELSIDCDDALAQADDGAAREVRGPFPGLGQVNADYCIGKISGPRAACAGGDERVLGYGTRLTVAGKGEIDVAVADACVPDAVNGTQTFTVTGGTGSYAGASGSGTLTRVVGPIGAHGRTGTETWTGTLEVPGFDFDTTPPTISGASNKVVKVKKTARRARVTYAVTASDAVDGALPVTCAPRPGSFFRLGRTRVRCSATDTSANTTAASFTVTVKRR